VSKRSVQRVVNISLLIAALALALVHAQQKTAPVFAFKWGTLGSAPGQLNAPEGIAVGSADRVYVADTNNHRVQAFDLRGKYLFEWGSLCDLETKEGCKNPEGEGQFNAPEGIAYSELSGILYVADSGNHRVQAFGPDGDFLFQWGRAGSVPGQFNNPVGLAVDEQARVYVADVLNHRVQVFDHTGRFVRGWGAEGSEPGQFRFPSGVAIFRDLVYVTDNNNHRVQRFDREGNFLGQWGTLCNLATGEGCIDPDGEGPLRLGDGQLRRPFGIAADQDGKLYVLDQGNSRVEVFDSEGAFVSNWGSPCTLFGLGEIAAGAGCQDPDGDGPLETGDGQFLFPKGIAITAEGTIYIADSDNHRVQVFH
jgi:tripartite motif-containing protein 71